MAFTPDDTARLKQQIIRHEGSVRNESGRHAAYLDSRQILTIGYGHNCISSPVPGISRPGDTITESKALRLFEKDLADHVWALRDALPWVTSLAPPRQAVLYDMAFNMGVGVPGSSGLLSFTRTLELIEAGSYEAASLRMLKSLWARQVKRRAVTLARQMKTGEWQI